MILLIVNDEIIIADAMRTEIDWVKYGIDQVYMAYDVSAAKEVIGRENIDILLCDIEMPRENGLMLLKWIREQELEIECVILTCHAKFTYAQEAMELGVQDYILLPAPYEKIGETIHKAVKRREKKEEERLYIQYGRSTIYENSRKDTENDSVKMELSQNLEDVISYIRNNITDSNMNVESIASHFHYHSVYLNRIFKKERKVSLRQFIIDERMKMASLIMKEGNYSVNEVAEMVGYSHYTNFYNMFKKTYKMSPAQYQQMIK